MPALTILLSLRAVTISALVSPVIVTFIGNVSHFGAPFAATNLFAEVIGRRSARSI